jgi:hypothetical protein
MFGRGEVRRSLIGAWSLFLDRRDALQYFDLSIDGFWRSFRVIVLVAPIYALIVLAEYPSYQAVGIAGASGGPMSFVLGKAAGLIVDWIAFPAVLALAARPLGIARTYPAFIIARFWGSVIAVAPFGMLAVLGLLGILGGEVYSILSLAVFFVVLRYSYLIASRALGVPTGFAVGIVAADLAVSLAVVTTVDAVFGRYAGGVS